VISGGAYGIDAAAHRGALAEGGSTVAVLACGAEVAYPAGHADLLEAIAASGSVVTGQPPGRRPNRLGLWHRGRLIAAISAGTVIVEAGTRGTSMNTARQARDLHRPLMAVPGPVTSEQSAGCHALIRAGATLVTDAADVRAVLSAQT
jgi:DNA processing protein